MRYKAVGGNLPILEFHLNKGDEVICEGGAMTYRSADIKMETSFGGVGGAFSRAFSGENMAFNKYTSLSDGQELAFASKMPGEILPVEFSGDRELIVQKSAFIASTIGINRKIHFQKKLSTGFFGGEGFIMQKLSGQGVAFLEIDGALVKKDLQPGEVLLIDTGHLVAHDSTAQMTIDSVKGLKNIFLGGEGLFNTKIIGPGTVYLQSMPISRLAKVINTNSLK